MTGYIFILAAIFGVGSWLIGLFELISMHSFFRFIFKIGIPVLKTSINIETDNIFPETGVTIREEEGKSLFAKDHKVYFLSQMFLFRIITPFPLKAIGKLKKDNTIDIVARLPIGTCLFFLFWLIGWTVGSIGIGIQSGESGSVGFGLIGWIFAGGIIGISYPIEKKRMKKMILELKQIITVHNRVDGQ